MQTLRKVTHAFEQAQLAGAFAEVARAVGLGRSPEAALSSALAANASPPAVSVLKSAVSAITTSDTMVLAPADMVSAFVDALAPDSAFARLLTEDRLVRAPTSTRLAAVIANASAAEVGEGMPTPVSEMTLAGDALQLRKAVSLIVVSDTLLRSPKPSARTFLDRQLRLAVGSALDASFVSIISAGVTPTTSAGATPPDAVADIKAALAAVASPNPAGLAWLAAADVARAAATLPASVGPVFAGATAAGGTIAGLPVFVVPSLPDGRLILVDAAGIAADIDNVEIDSTNSAAIQMDTAPANPPTIATVFRPLWQFNEVAIRARAWFGLEVFRPGSVAVIDVAWS